jgi:hypothetical protein
MGKHQIQPQRDTEREEQKALKFDPSPAFKVSHQNQASSYLVLRTLGLNFRAQLDPQNPALSP